MQWLFIAYDLLSDSDLTEKSRKKLIKVIIDSKNMYYIALTALFIDNSLTKLFGNLNSLFKYIMTYDHPKQMAKDFNKKYIMLSSGEQTEDEKYAYKNNIEKKVKKKIIKQEKK